MDKSPRQAPAALRLHGSDNVLVSTRIIDKGEMVEGVATIAKIMRGHKMAATAITVLPTIFLLVAFGRRVVESVQFSGGK